jgi:hypothetical protein
VLAAAKLPLGDINNVSAAPMPRLGLKTRELTVAASKPNSLPTSVTMETVCAPVAVNLMVFHGVHAFTEEPTVSLWVYPQGQRNQQAKSWN